jgi:energy-coupling factor transporter ATP-binding protein EcfA2
MSEDPKKVSKNDLRNSQFGGGFIDAETVNADRIGGDIYNVVLNQQPTLTRQEYRNRQALLTKVKNFWVKGVLEKSLYNQVLIELGLEERPDAITNPWNVIIETGDDSPQPLPEGTKVIDIFDSIDAGRTLLILGEPGSGKTTTLLELTRDLITRAQQDINHLIPVVLNLSSWGTKKRTNRKKKQQASVDWFTSWIVEELNKYYQIPKKFLQKWVKGQQLLLLLDGLDEVREDYREQCITLLNAFYQEYSPELVVCSRIKDYEALPHRFKFQKAVYLRTLTLEQVCHCLDSKGVDLTGLRALMKEDTALQELASSPLMLHIMALTYQGVAVEDLPKVEVVEEQRRQLFDDYIQKMFKRPNRSKGEQIYSEAQTKYWLIWLAQRMVQESQTVFLIEQMQPTWLQSKGQRILYRTGSFLIGGLIGGLSYGLIIGLNSGLIDGLNSGLTMGLIAGLISGWGRAEIKTVKIWKWPRQEARNSLRSGLIWGMMSGLIITLIAGLIAGLTVGLTGELIWGLMGLLMIMSITGLMMGLMGLLISVTIISLSGLPFGGGKALIQHFTLRLILYRNNYIPWNYARFLDYAAERIFLQKVGGGYIFIHRMLMEHFAQMELER